MDKIMECQKIARADLSEMESYIETIRRHIDTIDVCDDAEYADWVVGFTDRIREILLDLRDLSEGKT